MKFSIITGWCGNESHYPSYGYITMDEIKYDLCDIVKNLSHWKKQIVEDYGDISVSIKNGNVILNTVLLDKNDLLFGIVKDTEGIDCSESDLSDDSVESFDSSDFESISHDGSSPDSSFESSFESSSDNESNDEKPCKKRKKDY